jgi:hypothetical protein
MRPPALSNELLYSRRPPLRHNLTYINVQINYALPDVQIEGIKSGLSLLVDT